MGSIVTRYGTLKISTVKIAVGGTGGGGGGGVTDHGALTGLGDNDHPQYQLRSEKGQANGYVGLGSDSLVPRSFLPAATTSLAGTMSAADKTKLDGLSAPPAAATNAPQGLGTAAVGVSLAYAREDHVHAHGNLAGGLLHDVATGSVAGFMSAADKAKLDGIASGATVGPSASGTTPADLGTAAVGVSLAYARADHVHGHGNLAGGSFHSVAVASGAAGFMSGADKAKLDGIASGATVGPTPSAVVGTSIGTAAVGVSTAYARADHVHDLTFSVINTILTGANAPINVGGQRVINGATPTSSSDLATKGYVDSVSGGGGGGAALSDATPLDIGTASAGTGILASRDDHVHAHGNQAGGSLHAAATTSVAGFMSAADKTKLDSVATGATALSLASATPTDLGTAAVGVGTTAARADHVHGHGNLGGGSLHANVVASGASGFMTGADKAKLDGIATGATNLALASTTPADLGTAAVGVGTTAARADHVHGHGNLAGGSFHAVAVASGAAGFMSGADKAKLDAITGTNTGDQTITLTGNVTGSGTGSISTTIANAAVTLAKMADLAQDQVIGRVSASTGVPETFTITAAARTVLDDTTVAAMRTTLGAAAGTGTANGTNTGDQTITLTGDVTGSGTGSFAATIGAGAVTLSKIANIATDRLLGRVSASSGVVEEIPITDFVQSILDDADAAAVRATIGAASGSGSASGVNTGDQTITLTGNVTGSGTGSFATTIAAGVVTNSMLANVSTATFKGRTTAGSGSPEDLTATQATALLNGFVGDSGSGGTKGLVPAPAAGDAAANKVLGAGGSWVTQSGGGGSGTLDVLRLYADYFLDADSNWTISAPATLEVDSVNAAWLIRAFDQTTQEAVGFDLFVNPSAANFAFYWLVRAKTSGFTTSNGARMRLHYRENGEGTWSTYDFAAWTLSDVATWQRFSATGVTLATIGLTAGRHYQCMISRNVSDAADTLTRDLCLRSVTFIQT